MEVYSLDNVMPKLFKKYPEEILAALALVFSALMIWYFIFGIASGTRGIVGVFDVNKGATGNTGFNIPAAAKLDLRGLVQ